MTVTKEQAQILTTLAIACRPHRAPTWDAAGVMAAIQRVRDKSLSEVALAVIRAAADREAQTPGTIAALNGSAWQEQLKPPLWQPEAGELGEFCGVCGKKQGPCERVRFADDDHRFTPDSRQRQDIDTERARDALKELARETPPERPEPVAGTEGTSRVAELRAHIDDTSRVTRVRVALHEAEEAHA